MTTRQRPSTWPMNAFPSSKDKFVLLVEDEYTHTNVGPVLHSMGGHDVVQQQCLDIG